MAEHPIQGLMSTAMESIKEMVDVNTIVGDAVQAPDGTVIIPISKVTFGFAAGGGEFASCCAVEGESEEGSEEGSKPESKFPFAGGSGAGVSINRWHSW
ncbi:sporulation protein YtfJ [Acetivibrio straminisolvens JCM 21531]|uniref:Sporulation protein YtfJ n=1 Tax=Acetivibrio straminisolvens JCM 21531 TaxID=1294263 RepID=W4V8I4_9FIRM|nr:sporulation protein YtfJ [Acetivibrio straminisolvens JCM 21531]